MSSTSLEKGAALFKRAVAQAKQEGRDSFENGLRIKLSRRFKEAADVIAGLYVHQARIDGKQLLNGDLPAALVRSVCKGAAAILLTENPRKSWLATMASMPGKPVCVSVDVEDGTVHVYQLDQVTETDLCQMR